MLWFIELTLAAGVVGLVGEEWAREHTALVGRGE